MFTISILFFVATLSAMDVIDDSRVQTGIVAGLLVPAAAVIMLILGLPLIFIIIYLSRKGVIPAFADKKNHPRSKTKRGVTPASAS